MADSNHTIEMSVEQAELGRRIGSFTQQQERRYATHMMRLRVRRMLLELAQEAMKSNATGVNIPAPFDKSQLIIKTMVGDAADAVQNYATRIAANPPVVNVDDISRKSPSQRLRNAANDQEKLLMAMWHGANGRKMQMKAAWSASWGRVGYYLTLPREAGFGLPAREYFDEYTDEQIEELASTGTVVPVKRDREVKFAEPADTWFERRKEKMLDDALSGRSLFTLEEFPPDMVWPELTPDDKVARAVIIQEVSADEYQPGTDKAKEIAHALGVEEGDVGKFGVWSEGGKIITGVRAGTEKPTSYPGQTFRLIIYVDREIVAYVIAAAGESHGRVVYTEHHGAGTTPLVAVPAMTTDSRRDGSQFASPMESVFTLVPIINQIETLLSNVAAYNAIPRWVVEDAQGNLVRDPDTGQPKMIASDPTVGLDPSDAEVVSGKVTQLKIDGAFLVQLLEFYLTQLEAAKPAPVTEGQTGSSGPAWTVRQQLEAATEQLQHPVDNHAGAVNEIMQIWGTFLRGLDVPIYAISQPGKRETPKTRRGLVTFHPKDFITTFVVRQDKTSASERVVLAQSGMEQLEAGVIDDYEFYTNHMLSEDPEEMIIRKYVQMMKRFILLGDTSQLQPGSLLWRVSMAVQGQVAFDLLEQSPNFALGMAEQLAANAMAAQQAQQAPNAALPPAAAGQPAEAMGIRQAGVNASTTLPGSPAGREDEVAPLGV